MIKSLNKSIDVSNVDKKLGIVELEDRTEMTACSILGIVACPAIFGVIPPLCPLNSPLPCGAVYYGVYYGIPK